jgi:hypothetical protein
MLATWKLLPVSFRIAKSLQKAARAPAARRETHRLQGEAEATLPQTDVLKLQARLSESKKGSKTYTYWMASWREDDRTRNVHLGRTRKMDAEMVLGMRE